MLRAFVPKDIERIVPQASQLLDAEGRARIVGQSVPRGPCWTYEGGDGRVLCIGGFAHVHGEWATAWTILADDIGAAMVGLTRAVRQQLHGHACARIDMHVDPAHLPGARWAALLGFRMEAWLERALPMGRPMGVWLFERENHG